VECHVELCTLAYNFRNLASLKVLTQKHSAATAPSVWSEVRHYIGRLGSWSKASKVLLNVATTYPNLIASFSVDSLVSPPPMAVPGTVQKTNLDSALGRMLQPEQNKLLDELKEILRDNPVFSVLRVPAAFVEAYTNKKFKPRIHAELLVLEHFHFKQLEFVNRDRYIGCSKPSCYCCDLYMKHHPGNFVIRACHGNLWTNWRPPIPPTDNTAIAEKHTRDVLDKMVKKIRADVISQILSKKPPGSKAPDSTTGISTILSDLRITTDSRPVSYYRLPIPIADFGC